MPSDPLRLQREQLATACRDAAAAGLAPLASGNASLRLPEGILITVSGARFATMEPDQLILVDQTGRPLEPGPAASSETPLHLAVYARRPDVGAVMHTHGARAVALSAMRTQVPALHYYCADLGGPPSMAPYRPYGTEELAQVTVAALEERHAVVMTHHGSLTVASGLAKALDRAELLEWLCEVSLLALAAGTPAELDDAQVAASVQRAARPAGGTR
ncbi:class II aldolase/adducin family protein [Nocardioides mangrovicus]|nr:class II aldolase/adducin family protein [Nocardioides mangrovicus]